MGEVVEDMMEGSCCSVCGEWFHDGESPGYQRTCARCEDEPVKKKRKKK